MGDSMTSINSCYAKVFNLGFFFSSFKNRQEGKKGGLNIEGTWTYETSGFMEAAVWLQKHSRRCSLRDNVTFQRTLQKEEKQLKMLDSCEKFLKDK